MEQKKTNKNIINLIQNPKQNYLKLCLVVKKESAIKLRRISERRD